MTIAIGDALPDLTLSLLTADGPKPVQTKNFFAGKTIVMFGLPGAFTPTCHKNHLPGFLANADKIKAKGIDTIATHARACLPPMNCATCFAWQGLQVSALGIFAFLKSSAVMCSLPWQPSQEKSGDILHSSQSLTICGVTFSWQVMQALGLNFSAFFVAA